MQRYRAFDPPEYVDWQPHADVMDEYRQQLRVNVTRKKIVDDLDRSRLVDLYRGLVRNRLHDVQLKRWVMQGVLSKAWLGTGEEAVTIGAVHALERPADGDRQTGDVVGPMIRNAGACHEMGMPLADLLRAYLGTQDTVLQGRDLHLGDLRYGVMAPISMVASLVPVCAGLALAFKQTGSRRLALTWVGDGAARTGEFHEGMSMAAALDLPMIVVLQNNQVALGTEYATHSRVPLTELARGYVAGQVYTCHGNNVLDVYATTRLAAEQCRRGRGPVILVSETGRMGGHATHDESEARSVLPAEHFAYWGRRDPIGTYETYLIERLDGDAEAVRAELDAVAAEVENEIERAAMEALVSRDRAPADARTVDDGVYADATTDDQERAAAPAERPASPALESHLAS